MNLHNNALSQERISELVQKIEEIIDLHPEILLAYLYGSVVKGPFTAQSDIDIGLYITPETVENQWYPIQLKKELEINLKNNLDLGFQRDHGIDIRIINKASPKYQYSVIYQNPRILVRDEQVRVNFEKRVMLEWYDMRPTWDNFYKEREEWLKVCD
ncbi:MAG: type VII toxin-antitoxin system MntA family adenylyltransferase antitoxin [Promethearchaeota archaeon]